MIFEISDIDTLDSNTIDALDKLAMAFRMGHCILVARRRILETVYLNPDVSTNTRRTFKYIFDNISNYKSYSNGVRTIHVGSTETDNPDTVSFKSIAEGGFDKPAILLSENVKDANMYRNILQYMINRKKNGVIIVADTRGGGGDTTARELDNIIGRKDSFVVCITDNDRIYPTSNIGSTASKIVAVHRKNGYKFSDVLVIDAREIENCIPYTLISRKLTQNDPRMKVIQYISTLNRLNPEAIKYIDIKSGLKRIKYKSKITDIGYRTFWMDYIEQVSLELGVSECTCQNNECHCFIIPPFGEQYTEIGLKDFENIEDSDLLPVFEQIWDQIYEKAAYIFIGKQRTPVEFMPAI